MDHDWSQESNSAPPSKQFQSKKYKDSNNQFIKANGSVSQASFTPFKSSTLTRSTTPLSTDTPRSSTLRPSKPNAFVYDPPVSQSTPKAVRPGSAMGTMQREQKLTWGRLPQPNANRAASAMGHTNTLRSQGRHQDMNAMAGVPNGVSRFQSYCTLPRPEQLEPEMLMQMNVGPPHFYTNNKIISRPPSAMAMGPMSNEFVQPPSVMHPPMVIPSQVDMMVPHLELVDWNTLSALGVAQILVSIAVFCFGVIRILNGSKWAVGVELALSLLVMIAGLAAVFAVQRRSYFAACLFYCVSFLNLIFSIPSVVLGLGPLFKEVFPNMDSSMFVAKDEQNGLDYGLTAVIGFEIVICIIACLSACRSVSSAFTATQDLRNRNEVDKCFPGSPLMRKA